MLLLLKLALLLELSLLLLLGQLERIELLSEASGGVVDDILHFRNLLLLLLGEIEKGSELGVEMVFRLGQAVQCGSQLCLLLGTLDRRGTVLVHDV